MRRAVRTSGLQRPCVSPVGFHGAAALSTIAPPEPNRGPRRRRPSSIQNVQGLRAGVVAVGVLALVAAPSARAAIVQAQSSLPPGESGFVSVPGVASGTGSPHLYDQQDDYIHFHYKNAALGQPGKEEDPTPGVKIVRDAFG